MGGLELQFGDAPEVSYVEAPRVKRGKKIAEPNHEQENKDSLELDELRTKEEQVAMLILEDPVEFERQLADGELEEMIDDAGSDGQD